MHPMPEFLSQDELLHLENFQLKIQLNDEKISGLKETDGHRALRSEMLLARIDALRLEVESLKLPDKKLYDQLVLRMAQAEHLRQENKRFVDGLKEKYHFPEDEDFGYNPDDGMIICRDEAYEPEHSDPAYL